MQGGNNARLLVPPPRTVTQSRAGHPRVCIAPAALHTMVSFFPVSCMKETGIPTGGQRPGRGASTGLLQVSLLPHPAAPGIFSALWAEERVLGLGHTGQPGYVLLEGLGCAGPGDGSGEPWEPDRIWRSWEVEDRAGVKRGLRWQFTNYGQQG